MTGRLFIETFFQCIKEKESELKWSTLSQWTEGIGTILEDVAEKLQSGVSGKKPSNREASEEYLGIDFMFFQREDYNTNRSVLPVAIIEHENSFNKNKIEYCLWKILCVRSPIKILICYQKDDASIKELRQELESVIWKGGLMKGSFSDLIVMIGNEDSSGGEWQAYYSVYEWRGDALKKWEG